MFDAVQQKAFDEAFDSDAGGDLGQFADVYTPEVSPETAVNYALEQDPDQYKESSDLAKNLNLPKESVDDDIEYARRVQKEYDINIEKIKQENPALTKYLSNIDNASMSIDDIINLKATEDSINQHGRTWGEFGADTAIDVFKSAVTLGESAIGLMDLLTFNSIGNFMEENLNYSPDETRETIGRYYSKSRKRADRKVAEAQGFVDSFGAFISNPSSAFGAGLESLPMMLTGAGAVRSLAVGMLKKQGLKLGTAEANAFLMKPETIAKLTTASAISEGAMTAGLIQEHGRAEGRDYLDTAPYALLAGVGTAFISKASSALPFMQDVETATAVRSMIGASKTELLTAGKEIGKGMFKEGFLEEMPQSMQEEIFTNLAMGKPWNEGVGKAGAMGLVLGSGLGGAMTAGSQVGSLMTMKERHIKTAVKSVAEQNLLDEVLTLAQSSKTNQRSAEKFQEFVGSIGEGHEIVIPSDVAEEWEDAPDYVKEQLNDLNHSVTIPLKRFASEIAGNEAWMKILRPHIKLSETSMSQTELGDADNSQVRNIVKLAVDEKEVKTEADQIFEDVKDQLKASGMLTDHEARKSAELIPAYVTATVMKLRKRGINVTPSQIYSRMGLEVKSPLDPLELEEVDLSIMDQDTIPDDMEIELSQSTGIDGETETVSRNAKELSLEVDNKIQAYEKLKGCLI